MRGMSAVGDVVKFTPFIFDYAALPVASATSLREQAARIRELVKTATGAIIDVGLRLQAVKDLKLDHGQFGDWVEAECGFTLRSAERYMRAAEFARGKNHTVSILPAKTLYLISSKSAAPEVVEEVLARAATGSAPAPGDVKRMMDEVNLQRRVERDANRKKERRSAAWKRKQTAQDEIRRQEYEREENQRTARIAAEARHVIERFGTECAKFLLSVPSIFALRERLELELRGPADDSQTGVDIASPEDSTTAVADSVKSQPATAAVRVDASTMTSVGDPGPMPPFLRIGSPDCWRNNIDADAVSGNPATRTVHRASRPVRTEMAGQA
jgi:hypothetical protein